MTGHVLLTGFESFGPDPMNPSGELAKALAGRVFGRLEVQSLVLPVQHEAAREAVSRALGTPGLRAVVQLGLAGGHARVALESIGVNTMDYAIPDNAGAVIRNAACVPGGMPALGTTLPIADILAELTAAGIPAYLSSSAGTFLCNFTLYTTLHDIAERGLAIPAGFMHLPYLPAMVAAHGCDEPSMDLALMQRAVEIALGVIARA